MVELIELNVSSNVFSEGQSGHLVMVIYVGGVYWGLTSQMVVNQVLSPSHKYIDR